MTYGDVYRETWIAYDLLSIGQELWIKNVRNKHIYVLLSYRQVSTLK